MARSGLKRAGLSRVRARYIVTASRIVTSAPGPSPASLRRLDRLWRPLARSGLKRAGLSTAKGRWMATVSRIAASALGRSPELLRQLDRLLRALARSGLKRAGFSRMLLTTCLTALATLGIARA